MQKPQSQTNSSFKEKLLAEPSPDSAGASSEMLAPVPDLTYKPPINNGLVTHIQRDSTQLSLDYALVNSNSNSLGVSRIDSR